MCFSDLRQLLDLFVAWDWSTYLVNFNSNSLLQFTIMKVFFWGFYFRFVFLFCAKQFFQFLFF